jgi:hypothetical protein
MFKKLLVAGGMILLVAPVLIMSALMGMAEVPQDPLLPEGTITPTTNPYPTSGLPRQGVASGSYDSTQPYLAQLADWAYVYLPAWGGDYPQDHKLVPFLTTGKLLPSVKAMQQADLKTPDHDYWLVFNECELMDQCEMLPEEQAEFYHDDILPQIAQGDPDARLIIGGTTAHECGLAWLSRFVRAYQTMYGEDPPRAGWHFHIYPDVAPRPNEWQLGQACPDSWHGEGYGVGDIEHYIAGANRVRHWWSLYGSPDDEIWVTETGCLNSGVCPPNAGHRDMVHYMAAVTAYLNGDGRWIDRYAWYTDIGSDFDITELYLSVTTTPTPKPIGRYYPLITPSAHEPGFQYLALGPAIFQAEVQGFLPMTPTPPGYPAPYP